MYCHGIGNGMGNGNGNGNGTSPPTHHYPSVQVLVLERTKALSSASDSNPHVVAMLASGLIEHVAALEGGDRLAAKREALGYLTLLVSIDAIRAKAWAKRARELQREIETGALP